VPVRDGFPLQWPIAHPRRATREHGRFSATRYKALIGVQEELRRLGASVIVITTNIPTRRDGLPYTNMAEPVDPGVAAYWTLEGIQYVIANDQYDTVAANLHAIQLTIAAMRGIERWGTTKSTAQAFAGFKALPPPEWRSVLGNVATLAEARTKYRELAREAHPDFGGSNDKMTELNEAMEAAEAALKPLDAHA
jgi:hypothetical protein